MLIISNFTASIGSCFDIWTIDAQHGISHVHVLYQFEADQGYRLLKIQVKLGFQDLCQINPLIRSTPTWCYARIYSSPPYQCIVSFLQNNHKRQRTGELLECLLLVQALINIMPRSLQFCIHYPVILQYVITALPKMLMRHYDLIWFPHEHH